MSTDELKEIIGSVVEQKLKEILGDPEEAFEIRLTFKPASFNSKKLSPMASGATIWTRLRIGWVLPKRNV